MKNTSEDTRLASHRVSVDYNNDYKQFYPLIIVSGLPRSGTSWVAKALSFASGFTYYREPDNCDHVQGAYRYFSKLYLPHGCDDPNYRQHMTAAFNGQIVTPFTMSECPGPLLKRIPRPWNQYLGNLFSFLYFRKSGRLVKLVNSNLALEWMSENFPHARQVCVLRHPCGVFASWHRFNWQPQPRELLDNDLLVQDYLVPYVDIIMQAKTFWERAGALWGAIALVLQHQLSTHPKWLLVQHEWLCQNPVSNFQSLYSALNLSWSDRVEAYLERLDQSAGNNTPYSITRKANHEIDKWKHQLAPDEISECQRVVEKFNLSFYPDFEPVAHALAPILH